MKLRCAHLDRQGREIVPRLRSDRPLHQPPIARPDHPDPACMPGRLTEPPQGRQTVAALVERAEPALGAERATHALDHTSAPAPPTPARTATQPPDGAHMASAQHRRLSTTSHDTRDPTIGQQHRAIVHRHAQIALTQHIVRLRLRQTYPPSKNLTRDAHRSIVSLTLTAMARAPVPLEPLLPSCDASSIASSPTNISNPKAGEVLQADADFWIACKATGDD